MKCLCGSVPGMAVIASKIGGVDDGFVNKVENIRHSRHVSIPAVYSDHWKCDEDVFNVIPRHSYSSSRAEELIKEVAAIEAEITHLERHILSLYRSAFASFLPNSHTLTQNSSFNLKSRSVDLSIDSQCLRGFPEKITSFSKLDADNNSQTVETDVIVGPSDSDQGTANAVLCKSSSSYHLPRSEISETQTVKSQHLWTPTVEDIYGTPNKLSEDILKCISAVYCKLNKRTTHARSSSSPVSSLSSSTTFSARDQSDSWSPRFFYDPTTSSPPLLKEAKCPYDGMVHISRICIDRMRFKQAAVLLEAHRLLIKCLESVDPSKLDHEEKLAFWINIHNAMVMHAFIAYGLENNQIRSTPTVMKKSYNVGGATVNAYDIQTCVFGLRALRPEPSKLSVLSPTRKLKSLGSKQCFALDRPEPLVHFALCLGAQSDPALRVYTAKNIIPQFQLAREEFIQANFLIHKETKITLPKIVEFYAKDAFLVPSALLEIINSCLTENQAKALLLCIKGRKGTRIGWSSYKSTFRYILHRDLDSDK